jgi:hypothetical protein
MALQLAWIGKPTAFYKSASLTFSYEVKSFCFTWIGRRKKLKESVL